MDSSYRDIPIVEDDMGEGFKDPIEENESEKDRSQREHYKLLAKLKDAETHNHVLAHLTKNQFFPGKRGNR